MQLRFVIGILALTVPVIEIVPALSDNAASPLHIWMARAAFFSMGGVSTPERPIVLYWSVQARLRCGLTIAVKTTVAGTVMRSA